LGQQEEENPWIARADFLHEMARMDGRNDYASLTAWYGRFGFGSADLQYDQYEGPDPEDRYASFHLRLLQDDIEEWYQLLRAALTMPLDQWPSLAKKFPSRKVNKLLQPLPLKLQWREGKPVGTVTLRSFIDTIVASIQIDKLRGAEFRYCARSDCTEPFQVESRHERIYCSTDCAHYMAVKNSRARAEKNKGRQQTAKKQKARG
jgi:hypothetical protein